jgi:hypothetical protein
MKQWKYKKDDQGRNRNCPVRSKNDRSCSMASARNRFDDLKNIQVKQDHKSGQDEPYG